MANESQTSTVPSTTIQSQEVFKRTVEQDIARRHKERLVRKQQSDVFKQRGNTAFRSGDLEKALSCYSQSIECIRDSAILYTNRALTYINMELYDRAIDDCMQALRIDSDSMKAWLYLAKCYIYKGVKRKADRAIKEVKNRHPSHAAYIEEYANEVRRNYELQNQLESFNFEDQEEVSVTTRKASPPSPPIKPKKKDKQNRIGRRISKTSDGHC